MKILLITEKSSVCKLIEEAIKKHPNELPKENTYSFAKISPTFHIEDNFLRFRTDENFQIYKERKIIKEAKRLTLNKIEIPKGTFFEANISFRQKVNSCYDLIIGCSDYDSDGILALQKFCELNNIEHIKFYKLLDLTDKSIISLLKLEDLEEFNDILIETLNKLKKNNFSSDYKREVDILKIRKQIGWTRREFSDYFQIPYRTVENWEFLENECPKYLYDLILYKLKQEHIL